MNHFKHNACNSIPNILCSSNLKGRRVQRPEEVQEIHADLKIFSCFLLAYICHCIVCLKCAATCPFVESLFGDYVNIYIKLKRAQVCGVSNILTILRILNGINFQTFFTPLFFFCKDTMNCPGKAMKISHLNQTK